eukprot:2402700-Rhodomonas_salina.1
MSGTDIPYAAIPLRACFPRSGTQYWPSGMPYDAAIPPTRCPVVSYGMRLGVLDTELGYGTTSCATAEPMHACLAPPGLPRHAPCALQGSVDLGVLRCSH